MEDDDDEISSYIYMYKAVFSCRFCLLLLVLCLLAFCCVVKMSVLLSSLPMHVSMKDMLVKTCCRRRSCARGTLSSDAKS